MFGFVSTTYQHYRHEPSSERAAKHWIDNTQLERIERQLESKSTKDKMKDWLKNDRLVKHSDSHGTVIDTLHQISDYFPALSITAQCPVHMFQILYSVQLV
jgi:hypothetical protein